MSIANIAHPPGTETGNVSRARRQQTGHRSVALAKINKKQETTKVNTQYGHNT